MLEAINKGIYEYDDKMLRFVKRSMQSVPYLANLEAHCLYDIIYSLETQKKAKGEVLQRRGDDADELYFLQSGIIEVYTEFEGKEFVIERLFRGSIVNYRTFFMEEGGVCALRFATASVVKALRKATMAAICAKHPKVLGKTFGQYKLKIIKEQKGIPLDYVMVLPKKITRKIKRATRTKLAQKPKYRTQIEKALAKDKEENGDAGAAGDADKFEDLINGIVPAGEVTERMRRAFALENMLKNVAIRQIVKIREINEKPSLKEAVKQILARQSEEDAKKRRKLKKKLTREYEDNAAENAEAYRIGTKKGQQQEDEREQDDKDGLFSRVIVGMDRLLKVLTSHSAAVDSLEKKLSAISAAKKRKTTATAAEPQGGGGLGSPPPGEDGINDTGDLDGLEDFEGADDNLDFIDQSDLDRDQFMDELKRGYEPNEAILAPYRIPVEPQKQLRIASGGESLADITSEESEEPQDSLSEEPQDDEQE